MVNNIHRTLEQVKADLPEVIAESVAQYQADHPEWVHRDRQLPPHELLLYFITQIMHGNTAINHLRHLAGMTCSAAAYCKARMRLPLALVQQVSQCVIDHLRPDTDEVGRWRGHRVWRSDGTNFSMPDTAELQAHFGQPGGQRDGCGFPVANVLVLCNAAGLIIKAITNPLRTHEASQITKLHDELAPGDLLVYDRAGCSYAHLALLLVGLAHAIIRLHQKQIVSFRKGRKHARQYPRGQRRGKPKSQWIKHLGICDQLVRWFKPTRRPLWMSEAQFAEMAESIVVRELRFKVHQKGFRTKSVTIVTTLLDPELYPAEELAQQYLDRWEIETNFRHLKQTMGMDVLKCKTVDGVLKEQAVFVLVYNMVRMVMLRAAQRQRVPVSRISFIDALRWLQHAGDSRELIDLIVNPKRFGRYEPRVVKRRPKQYPLMTETRAKLKKKLENGKNAA